MVSSIIAIEPSSEDMSLDVTKKSSASGASYEYGSYLFPESAQPASDSNNNMMMGGPVEETETTTTSLGFTGRTNGDLEDDGSSSSADDDILDTLPPLRSVTPSTSVANSLDGSSRRNLFQNHHHKHYSSFVGKSGGGGVEEESHHGSSVELSNTHQARGRVTRFTSSSCLSAVDWELPAFAKKELMVGRYLGRGAFSVVEEIHGVRLDDELHEQQTTAKEIPERMRQLFHQSSTAEDDHESRLFIAEHCTRPSGDARYAIKKLRADVAQDPEKSWGAVTDLLLETHFLRHFEHPHIIKLRGTASCDPYKKEYFLVLDRLYETLSTRLLRWEVKIDRVQQNLFRRIFQRGKLRAVKCELLMERVRYAYNLSAALKYIHKRNVIHRDIKPENIGFDVRGDIKIFDFGLARELLDSDARGDGTYLLTNMTGSLRYMAPEVFVVDTPYNDKCDVYSFAVLFWQMLSLRKPYQELKKENSFVSKVMYGGCRPEIKKKWPKALRGLLKDSWNVDPKQRLSMTDIHATLREEVSRLWACSCEDDVLDTSRRRSTFVYRALSKRKTGSNLEA